MCLRVKFNDRAFDNIWIQPAAGDGGGSLGAALCAYHHFQNQPRSLKRESDSMEGAYLGPEYNNDEIQNQLELIGAKLNLSFKCLFDLIRAIIKNTPKDGYRYLWATT